jgi:2-aminobenzoate-CoA ligase
LDRAPDALALTLTDARSRWAVLIDENLPPPELWPRLLFRLPGLQYPDTLNLAERLLTGAARAVPDEATSIIYRGAAISYGELRRRVFAFAAHLIRLGVQPTDRVALRLHNCPEYIVSWLAVQWIGAIGVAVPPVYRLREIAHIVNHSRATVVMCSVDLAAEVESARPRFAHETVTLVVPFDGLVDRLSPPTAHPTARHDPALITYVASATGAPKGVVHSPVEILATADTYARDVLDLSPDDICLGSSSLAWSYGLGASLVFPLHAGAATALLDGAGPPLPVVIAASRPTVLFSVPTMYRMLLRQPDLQSSDLTSLRRCISAAEPLPAWVVEAWRARTGLEILDGLGTTELAHIFISARPGAVRPGSIGTPVAGYEARIVDDRFAERPRGVAGMLAVRGPTGGRYWRDADAQRCTFRDGWTLTGDLCVQSQDGWFEHIRRVDDLIVCGGYKISPAEVERALLDHPAVAFARVSAAADPLRGFVPQAVVSLRSGFEISGAVDRLKQFLRQELASYKCPREILIRD